MNVARIACVAALVSVAAGCLAPESGATSGRVDEKPLKVAVFVGSGARNIGAFRWLEITARAKNVVATPVDGEAVRSGALNSMDVLVMPGGSSVTESKTLGPEGREKNRGPDAGCAEPFRPDDRLRQKRRYRC